LICLYPTGNRIFFIWCDKLVKKTTEVKTGLRNAGAEHNKFPALPPSKQQRPEGIRAETSATLSFLQSVGGQQVVQPLTSQP
jgi:hypothetical protein